MSGVEGCQFCLKYGESEELARNHRLRTATGLVSCPILRSLTCPICQATGDFAHTKSYCPLISVDSAAEMSNSNGMKTMNAMGKVPQQQPASKPWPLSSYQRLMNNYTGTVRHPLPPPAQPAFRQQEPTSPLLARHQQYLHYYR